MYQNKVTSSASSAATQKLAPTARISASPPFAGNEVFLQEGWQVHLAHRMASLRRLRQALGVRKDAYQGRTYPGGRRTAQPEYNSKKTDSKRRVWEIRVASILKLDRAEKATPEDQDHDEVPRRKRLHKPLLFTLGSPAHRWASIAVRFHHELELILPFLRPIESLLLDENVSEIMGNPTPHGGTNVMASCSESRAFRSTPASTNRPRSYCQSTREEARRGQPTSARTTPGRESVGGSHPTGRALYTSAHHQEIHQPPLHS